MCFLCVTMTCATPIKLVEFILFRLLIIFYIRHCFPLSFKYTLSHSIFHTQHSIHRGQCKFQSCAACGYRMLFVSSLELTLPVFFFSIPLQTEETCSPEFAAALYRKKLLGKMAHASPELISGLLTESNLVHHLIMLMHRECWVLFNSELGGTMLK